MAITEECREFLDSHFKLENYADATSIPLHSWLHNFLIRQTLLEESARWRKEECESALNDIFLDPLHKQTPNREWYDHHIVGLLDGSVSDEVLQEEWNDADGPQSNKIRELSGLDYFLIGKKVELMNDTFGALKDHVAKYLEESSWAECISKPTFAPFIHQYLENQNSKPWLDSDFNRKARYQVKERLRFGNLADIEVDLDCPDEALKEAFSSWLAERRSQDISATGKLFFRRYFDDRDIKKWVKFRTLQYLDLLLAGIYYDCELNDDEIGHYLFRDKIDARWVFNARDDMRTVKKYGAMMTDDTTLIALENSLDD